MTGAFSLFNLASMHTVSNASRRLQHVMWSFARKPRLTLAASTSSKSSLPFESSTFYKYRSSSGTFSAHYRLGGLQRLRNKLEFLPSHSHASPRLKPRICRQTEADLRESCQHLQRRSSWRQTHANSFKNSYHSSQLRTMCI